MTSSESRDGQGQSNTFIKKITNLFKEESPIEAQQTLNDREDISIEKAEQWIQFLEKEVTKVSNFFDSKVQEVAN